MKTKDRRKHIRRIFGVTLGLWLVIVGMGSLGIVWGKQQVTASASRCLSMEEDLVEMERKVMELHAQLAQVKSPSRLKALAQVKVGSPKRDQIVWMGRGPEVGGGREAVVANYAKRAQGGTIE